MKISIQELKEGAILAADVMSANGQLLLKSGNPVTEKHIRAFKTWGVKEVELPGEDKPEESFSPEILSQADQHLQNRFYGADLSNPILNRIYAICLKRLATQLATGVRS